MEELATSLGEGQIVEFVDNDELDPEQAIAEAARTAGADLGLELVD
jgi:hypothetical protein